MQLIYECEMGGCGAPDTLAEILEVSPEEENAAYMTKLVRGVQENKQEIDDRIASFLRSGWRLERISRVDLSILRLAVYEMLYEKEPAAVVINEAVELSHTYSTEEIGAFINGVLASISRATLAENV